MVTPDCRTDIEFKQCSLICISFTFRYNGLLAAQQQSTEVPAPEAFAEEGQVTSMA